MNSSILRGTNEGWMEAGNGGISGDRWDRIDIERYLAISYGSFIESSTLLAIWNPS